MRVQYVGPHDEVEVPATGHVVKRDGEIDVPDEIGRSLLEQDTWSEAAAKSKPVTTKQED